MSEARVEPHVKIVVMIPAFNEEDHIAQVVRKIPRQILGGHMVTVVVIDDGSADDTALAAREAGADVVVRHSTNQGVARAFMTGIRAAKRLDADVIVNIDADGQFDPAQIPDLVAPIIADRADVVLGSRFVSRSYRRIPVMKRLGNLIISLMISILSGQRIRDTQCGFRALSRRAAENLDLSGLFTYTQEMILDMSFERMRIVEVPISVRYFRDRSSRVVKSIPKYTLRVLGVILIAVLRQLRWALGLVLFSLVAVYGILALLAVF